MAAALGGAVCEGRHGGAPAGMNISRRKWLMCTDAPCTMGGRKSTEKSWPAAKKKLRHVRSRPPGRHSHSLRGSRASGSLNLDHLELFGRFRPGIDFIADPAPSFVSCAGNAQHMLAVEHVTQYPLAFPLLRSPQAYEHCDNGSDDEKATDGEPDCHPHIIAAHNKPWAGRAGQAGGRRL